MHITYQINVTFNITKIIQEISQVDIIMFETIQLQSVIALTVTLAQSPKDGC
jgi:hypothetical protein